MAHRSENAAHDPSLPPESYQTVAGTGRAEVKILRSRFLAEVTPAASLAAAKAVVAEVSRRHHDCRHVCFAWRGGFGPSLQEVRNDGGEPAGTAGEPILATLRQAEVTDCVAVVARYFGGIKLGTGGLARAYRKATAAALAEVERRSVLIGRKFTVSFPYARQQTVATLLERHAGRLVRQQYTACVDWTIWLPASRWRDFAQALAEATAGEITLKAPTQEPEPS